MPLDLSNYDFDDSTYKIDAGAILGGGIGSLALNRHLHNLKRKDIEKAKKDYLNVYKPTKKILEQTDLNKLDDKINELRFQRKKLFGDMNYAEGDLKRIADIIDNTPNNSTYTKTKNKELLYEAQNKIRDLKKQINNIEDNARELIAKRPEYKNLNYNNLWEQLLAKKNIKTEIENINKYYKWRNRLLPSIPLALAAGGIAYNHLRRRD